MCVYVCKSMCVCVYVCVCMRVYVFVCGYVCVCVLMLMSESFYLVQDRGTGVEGLSESWGVEVNYCFLPMHQALTGI